MEISKSTRKLKLFQQWTLEALFTCLGVSLSEEDRDVYGMGEPRRPAISVSKSEFRVHQRTVTRNNPASGKMCWVFMQALLHVFLFTLTASKATLKFVFNL